MTEAHERDINQLFDYRRLRQRTGLSDDFLKHTMLRDFLTDSRRYFSVLEDDIASGDSASVEQSAHKLKGHFATLHMKRTAAVLEQIIKHVNDREKVLFLFEEVRAQLNIIHTHVRRMIQKRDAD